MATQPLIHTANKEGFVDEIYYLTWNNKPWKARLEPVRQNFIQVIFGKIKMSIDPDFFHTPITPPKIEHRDDYIAYITLDGTHWASKCHSHTDAASGRVSFTFEHFRAENLSHADHEDAYVRFLAEDGSPWQISIDSIDPIPDGKAAPLKFRCSKIA